MNRCAPPAARAEVPPPDLRALAAAGLGERTRILDRYVCQELGRVLGMPPEQIDTTGRPMNSLGVGSVNGLELRRRLETALRVDVDLSRLLLANSAAELVACLAGQLGAPATTSGGSAAHAADGPARAAH
jgi:hypothetical protein